MISKVTLIGTFRKSPNRLKQVHKYLTEDYQLLSPKDVNWLDLEVDFVKADHEKNDSVYIIEERVLRAIDASDVLWLFAPDGYVGLSASFEIGYAHSKGIPVFTDCRLNDELLDTMVRQVESIDDLGLQ